MHPVQYLNLCVFPYNLKIDPIFENEKLKECYKMIFYRTVPGCSVDFRFESKVFSSGQKT